MAKGYSPAYDREQNVTDQDMSTSFDTPPMQVSLVDGYSIQSVITGTPVGNLKLQISDIGGTDAANWADYPSASVNLTLSGPTPIIWEVRSCKHAWARLSYTATSGTGTMSATITRK